jgi:choline-sulfatase
MGKRVSCPFFCRASSTVLLLTAVSCGGDRRSIPPKQAHDLIVITIDTLRADRVAGDGAAPTPAPTLRAIGRDGAMFLDASAHVPLTLPSHASIFTGRFPPAHGVHDNSGFVVPESVPTLASTLRGAGYHTAAFVSSFVLRSTTGLANGFEVYNDRFAGVGRSRPTAAQLERRGPEVAQEALGWLATAPRPFFLWVHFYDPHAPYDPPPAFAARFPGHPYDGEVATSDFGVSMILNALPQQRRAETLIVATGDHGESLGAHGESEHGILLYDATLHVPLVMRGPGIAPGTIVREQVRHVDLLPTILALLGVAPSSPLDGVSLVPLLSGSHREQVPPSYAESRFGELHFGWSPIQSVRDGAWKYIDGPAPELYDLERDPGEQDNRHAMHASTSAALATVLDRVVEHDRGASESRGTAGADAAERLRSLGYVSGQMPLGSARGGHSDVSQRLDPKREIGRYERYISAFNEGLAQLESRPRDAEIVFRRLAGEFPLAFEAHQFLAKALSAQRAYPRALQEFDVAIGLAPRESTLYFDAARTLADARQFDRAIARVAEGRRLDPASFYGAMTEGLVAQAAGHLDRAEQAFRNAIAINPDLAVAHLELGRLAEGRGDRTTALEEYRRASAGDSTLLDARRALDRLTGQR